MKVRAYIGKGDNTLLCYLFNSVFGNLFAMLCFVSYVPVIFVSFVFSSTYIFFYLPYVEHIPLFVDVVLLVLLLRSFFLFFNCVLIIIMLSSTELPYRS